MARSRAKPRPLPPQAKSSSSPAAESSAPDRTPRLAGAGPSKRPRHRGSGGTGESTRLFAWLAPVVLVAAGLLAYRDSLRNPFLFDDLPAIVQNESIRALSPITRPLRPPRDTTVAGRPIPNLTLALNHARSGLDPYGYRLFNVAVHVGAGLLMFGLARRTLRFPSMADRFSPARADGIAFALALLWTVHPIQTESVTYLCQRVESVMGFFFLATFYCFARAAVSPRPLPWTVATILASALGMGSKEVMVTAPPLLLLYDFAFLGNGGGEKARGDAPRSDGSAGRLPWNPFRCIAPLRATFLRRRILHGGVWATLLVLFALVVTSPRGESAGFGMTGARRVGAVEYALTQPAVVLHYLRLSLWPDPLVLDYWWRPFGTLARIVPPLLALLAILAASIALFRRSRALGFWALWFFVILAPTSSIVPIMDLAFEHRLYLSLAGPIALAVVGADFLLRRFAGRSAGALGFVATLAVAAIYGGLTVRRNRDYASAETMYRDIAEKAPGNARAWSNLGSELLEADRYEEAKAALERSLAADPTYVGAWTNLSSVLVGMGDVEAARAAALRAVELAPDDPVARGRLEVLADPMKGAADLIGVADAQLAAGDPKQALRAARFAARLAPDDAVVQGSAGAILAEAGYPEEAEAFFRRATELRPDDPTTLLNLGKARMEAGKLDAAADAFARAVALDPLDAEAINSHGTALARLGRIDAAIDAFREALRIRPSHPEARANLELALRMKRGG